MDYYCDLVCFLGDCVWSGCDELRIKEDRLDSFYWSRFLGMLFGYFCFYVD